MADPRPSESGVSTPFAVTLALVLLLWLALSLPLALGRETLYFRDVFSTHVPFKAFGAETLRRGEIPALNPTWALGQPFRGNPNAVALYPGNLLYLVLPFWPAFNLHYVLHWLLAGVGMFLLARALARSRQAALMAALAYAGSGWMLAVLTFYNLLVVVAWWPFVILAAVRRGSAPLAFGGLACGLALLGGEPVTALLGAVPLWLLAWRAHGLRRGTLRTVFIGVAGVAVALPQLAASARVAATSFRGAHGVVASQASYFSLEPLRLLELALPYAFGLPGWQGPFGTTAAGGLDHLPFYFSIHFGLIALVLALSAARRRPLLVGLASSSLLLAWLGGLSGDLLLTLSGGFFRSPEKLLFWLALALPLLAAAGLDRARAGLALSMAGATRVAAGGLVIAAVALYASGGTPFSWWAPPTEVAVEEAQNLLWVAALLVAGLLLLGLSWLVSSGRADGLVALQLAGLLQLAPMWMTDDVALYRNAATPAAVTEDAVVVSQLAYPPWPSARISPDLPQGPPRSSARWLAAQSAPAPGVLAGRSYPLAPDLDGTHHLFYGLLEVELARAGWPERLRWLEVLGAERLITPRPLPLAGLVPTSRRASGLDPIFEYRPQAPLPTAWWPDRIEVAPTPRDAFASVARSPQGTAPGVLPRPVEHQPGGRVAVLAASADRLRLHVESGGGLIVVQRAFQPSWRAHAGEAELPILPANLALVGILVPPGAMEVTLEATAANDLFVTLVAVVSVTALLLVVVRARRRRPTELVPPER